MLIDSIEEEKYSKLESKTKQKKHFKTINSLQGKSKEIKSSSLENSNKNTIHSISTAPSDSETSSSFLIFQEDKEIHLFDESSLESKDCLKYSSEYINEIYFNLLNDEKTSTKPLFENIVKIQQEINERMRAILIDWLIDVHYHFNLSQQVLFTTVRIIDLFLSVHPIERNKFQLLGTTALLIACKFEEVFIPNVRELIYITDNTYKKEELIEMENLVLKMIKFDILCPTELDFFAFLSKVLKFEQLHFNLGMYLMQSFLLDVQNIKYSRSRIACATCYIVMKYFKIRGYEICYEPQYNSENLNQNDIKETAQQMCFLMENLNNSSLKSAQKKFSLEQFNQVALYFTNA